MPLVRLEVRNEYGLGQPELYSEANREDPKAVLDGVAVAGLVGILRQLGDLAEFAAEVFHGLQEQVMTTASRSRNLMVRVQNIEAALPPLEKAVLSQTSHIHFAYTAGSEWHPRIQNAENHFIYNDLPRFIMDSYEECRDPPRLHLLDKFDTGGPGSCLKRYSDPTFFRRISGNFKEPDVEKIQKYKKTHKRKKKRSSHRNGDLLRSTSISNHSNRFHAPAPIVNGRSSPSHTASSIDMTLKSELGDHSNSFDSRTGSGHVECVFHLNSSAQPEQEYEEFSSYLRHNDIPESVFPKKQSAVTDDSFQQSLSPEQIAPSSSCVTWDEKAEIVEPRAQHSDEDEAPDIPTTDSDVDIQGRRISNVCSLDQMEVFIDENNSMFSASRNQLEEEGKRISDVRSLNQMEVVFNDENNPKLSASRNQLEEVESEADNYMDALNTIESESENDLDCQTKHEVEQVSSDVVNEENEDGIHGIAAQISEHYSPKHESHTLSEISSNDEILHVLPELDSLNSITEGEKTANISGKSSNLDCSPSLEDSTSSDALNDSKVGSVIDGPSSYTSRISNLQEPLNPDTVSSSFKPQESQPQVSGVHSVTIWTNGGLLGLQPSKPPDFTRSKTASQDVPSLYESETTGPQHKNLMSKNDGERVKEGVIDARGMEGISNSKCSTSWHDDQDARVDKTDHANDNVRSSHAHGGTLNHISAVTQVNELPVDENVRATSTESKWENDDNSTQLFGLGRRLLANGFHRKTSLVPDNKPEPVSSLRAGVLEQRSGHRGLANHTTPEKESAVLFGHRSIIDPLTSSPPLEHMKISFHPMDDFGLSKLKLQFPDGSHCNESVRDAFPSFQLVPEPAVPLRDVGSDSDDDTFCRSSPYISDDYCSHHTESDSEEWEGGESPERKNNELYDSLCRTSSVEHVPTSLQLAEAGNNIVLADRGLKRLQGENGLDASLSATLLDFPSFDDMNPAIQGETNDNLDPNDLQEFQHPKESSPVPPPLPPVQWRVLKADSDIAESKQRHMFEAYEQTFDLKLLGTTLSQQPKPATAKEQQTNEGIVAAKPSNKQDPQKLIKQKEANQHANGKGMDEKEDFLHQIRSKSFTLRHTMTAKPTFGTGAAANDKVTAILEKANAIRQAVGSDDGDDDDNWSDT